MPRLLKLDLRPLSYDSVTEAVPGDDSDEDIEDDIELSDWRPITPPPLLKKPQVAFVDGVERRERRVTAEGEGLPVPGLLASYAAGAMCPGRNPAVRHVAVHRCLILSGGIVPPALTLAAHNGAVLYEPAFTATRDFEAVEAELRSLRAELEAQVVRALVVDGCELVVLDGRLPPRLDARVVGLIKTPQVLPAVVLKHFELLCDLRTGQRSPVFVRQRSDRAYYSWFVCLRSPGPFDPALSGLALLEIDSSREVALSTADMTAALLPQFASEPYQDDRAPQNLLPVGLLERELRHRLGEPELINRLLIETFHKEAPQW